MITQTCARFFLHRLIQLFGEQPVEKFLYAGCRKPIIRKCLRLGTLAYEYSNVLQGDSIRLAYVRNSYQLYVDLLEPPGVSSYFFGYADTVPFLDLILHKGEIFIDAGANRGQYTLFAASIVGETGQVAAFEPNPILFDLLKKSLAINKWERFVTVQNLALWNQSGQRMTFYLSTNPHRSGTSSLVFHGYDIDSSNTHEVMTSTLDDYLSHHHIPYCHVLKIDVERAENELLQGLKSSLTQRLVKYILIEMFTNSPAHQLLAEHGYQGFHVVSSVGLKHIEEIGEGIFGDYLFVSPDAHDEFMNIAPQIQTRLYFPKRNTWSRICSLCEKR